MTALDAEQMAAARLLLANGRWWVNAGAGPSEREFEHAGCSVVADPAYRAEILRDAVNHAHDLGDGRLAARLRKAAALLKAKPA